MVSILGPKEVATTGRQSSNAWIHSYQAICEWLFLKPCLWLTFFLPFCRTANHRGRITWTKYLQTFWYVVEKLAFNSPARRKAAVRVQCARLMDVETRKPRRNQVDCRNYSNGAYSLISTMQKIPSACCLRRDVIIQSTIKSVYGFSYASAECCKCQIETQIKDSLSCALLSRSSRQAGRQEWCEYEAY